jgi:transposase
MHCWSGVATPDQRERHAVVPANPLRSSRVESGRSLPGQPEQLHEADDLASKPGVLAMMPHNTAGIDVAKDWLDVATDERVKRVDNAPSALRALADELVAQGVTIVGMEPTGGYERLAVAILRSVGLDVRMVDSWRLRQFAKGRGTRAKTDQIDARMIALFIMREETRPFPEPSQAQTKLTAWVREVTRAEADIRRVQNRRTAAILDPIVARLDAEIAVLKQTVAEAERAIDAIIAEDPDLAAKAQLISSVPGVGPKTMRVILAELPELGHLTAQSIAALCGLAPYQRKSGKTDRGAHVEGGRAALKRAAFLAARAMALHNPWARKLIQHLRDNRKPYKVAIIALARRLIVALNAMVRDRGPWRQPA